MMRWHLDAEMGQGCSLGPSNKEGLMLIKQVLYCTWKQLGLPVVVSMPRAQAATGLEVGHTSDLSRSCVECRRVCTVARLRARGPTLPRLSVRVSTLAASWHAWWRPSFLLLT